MKLKLNRKFSVEPENIIKVKLKNNKLWIYLNVGYPKIIRADDSADVLRLKLANSGLTGKKLDELFKEIL